MLYHYTSPQGQEHRNVDEDKVTELYFKNGFAGSFVPAEEEQEEPDVIEAEQTALVPVITNNPAVEVSPIEPPTPPIALVSGPIAEAFGLTNNPAVEVSTIDSPPPVSVEEEEEDFANMRGRKFSSARDKFTVKSLEEILANLEDLRKKEDPQDYTRNINGFMVKFEGTQPMGQFMFRDGMGEPLRITRKAYRDLCHGLCGSGAIRYMDKLVRLPNGDKVAEMNLGTFRMNTERLHLFRTALGKDNKRAVPAILSDTYSRYDNVDLVKDVIMCLDDDIENWHVIRYNCRDGRLHVQLVHAEDAYFNKEVGVPIPGFTLKNGQYGDGSSSVSDSIFNLWCGNGMFNFNAKTTKRWNHTGDSGSRIRRDLPGLMEDIVINGNGLVESYNESKTIEIEDAYKWYTQQVADAHSDAFKEQVRRTILNEPTVHGNGRLLTSVPDALTFLAHQQNDLSKQMELERLGGELLHRGLQQAENNRILLPIG